MKLDLILRCSASGFTAFPAPNIISRSPINKGMWLMKQNYPAQWEENSPLLAPSCFQFRLDLGLYYCREGLITKENRIFKRKFFFGLWVLKGPGSEDLRDFKRTFDHTDVHITADFRTSTWHSVGNTAFPSKKSPTEESLLGPEIIWRGEVAL